MATASKDGERGKVVLTTGTQFRFLVSGARFSSGVLEKSAGNHRHKITCSEAIQTFWLHRTCVTACHQQVWGNAMIFKGVGAATVVLAVFASTISVAEERKMNMAAFVDIAGRNENAERMIGAAGKAYLWANATLEHKGQDLLFCAPRKLSMTSDQYVSILRNYIKDRPEEGERDPADFAGSLLFALQDAFPCEN